MYHFFTAAVTAGVIVFLLLYNTNFVQVVTLGGTVLGAVCVGIFSSLAAVFLRRVRENAYRLLLETVCNAGVLLFVMHVLPGWRSACSWGAVLFLLCLSAGLTVLYEGTLPES